MMKRLFLPAVFFLLNVFAYAQDGSGIKASLEAFNEEEQLKFGIAGLYVIDAKTGATVIDQHAYTGLAPASTQKIITAATALDVLGKDFSYQTRFGIVQTDKGKSLYIQASGDPTFGSWRWDETKEALILSRVKEAVAASGVKQLAAVIINTRGWIQDDGIPTRWTWEDIGQYYGAGAQGLNWRENQFDLLVRSGANIGDAVTIIKTNPYLFDYKIVSQARAAGKETGDESALYYPSKGEAYSVLKGTIPAGQNSFTVSGSMYDPSGQFAKTLIAVLKEITTVKNSEIEITGKEYANVTWIYTHTSPPLAKIIYWFLRKSVNLYGEALLRTMAFRVNGIAETAKGVTLVQEHWKDKGIHEEELHLYDGSGLSPQNRITPHAEVQVLRYAKGKPWFDDFYEALPLYNDMKMKSGTINRVKGFTGYQTAKNGKEYIFSMIVNNYNGSQYSLIRKMYEVLNHLK